MTYDIAVRDESVVIVGPEADTYTFDIVSPSVLRGHSDVPHHVIDWIGQNTPYELSVETVGYPTHVTCDHSLTGTVGTALRRSEDKSVGKIIDGGNISLDAETIHTNWDIHEDGYAELTGLEYDETTYLPRPL